MQRYLLSLMFGTGLCLAAAGTARAQQCPVPDVRAAVDQACPCASARNHGQYMKCVRTQLNSLRSNGCDVSPAMRCAEMSVCGRPQNPVVCCNRKAHGQILPAAKCASRHGTIAANVTSVCDASCATAPNP